MRNELMDREPITSTRLKDAHRRLMLANHPDRGGAPYLAGKVNEAKALLEYVHSTLSFMIQADRTVRK
jgi:hypothetical protein